MNKKISMQCWNFSSRFCPDKSRDDRLIIDDFGIWGVLVKTGNFFMNVPEYDLESLLVLEYEWFGLNDR